GARRGRTPGGSLWMIGGNKNTERSRRAPTIASGRRPGLKDFPAETQDHPGDNQQEKNADERIAFENSEPGSGERSQDVAQPHRRADLVKDLAAGGEIEQRRKVGGEVDHFRVGGRGQEVKSKPADENEHQKTARAGAEETVVKPDEHTDQHSKQLFPMGRELWRVESAEILPPIGVEGDGDQQAQNQRL